MSKIRSQICLNGEFFYEDETLFSVHNRAFLYGDAVFESMFASGKSVPLLPMHLERLKATLHFLEMEAGELFKEEKLLGEISRLLNKNRLFKGARIRLTVFRNQGGRYMPSCNTVSYVIQAEKKEVERFTLNTTGIVLGSYEKLKLHYSPFSPHKTTNCLPYIKAGLFKQQSSFHDCVLWNERGYAVEAISSNLFVLLGDMLVTPSLETGCIDGVMRKKLIALARAHGYQVSETDTLSHEMLYRADEMFLSNAVQGIQWVVAWKDRRFLHTESQKLLRLLNKDLNLD